MERHELNVRHEDHHFQRFVADVQVCPPRVMDVDGSDAHTFACEVVLVSGHDPADQAAASLVGMTFLAVDHGDGDGFEQLLPRAAQEAFGGFRVTYSKKVAVPEQ